jgi:predicted DNA-binding protein
MPTEKQLGVKQIPFRMPQELYERLKVKMLCDGTKFQRVVIHFINLYLDEKLEAPLPEIKEKKEKKVNEELPTEETKKRKTVTDNDDDLDF